MSRRLLNVVYSWLNVLSGHRPATGAVVGILLAHGALLAWAASRHSPTWDELGHLVAGISHWQFGAFDVYRVNPPLVRMVGSLPVLLAQPKTDWGRYDATPGSRPEWQLSTDFAAANRMRTLWLIVLARWACIPFSLIGAWFCFRWARELYGQTSGILAALLWCFDPNILAHAQLITTDAAAAALGLVAAYSFWRWLQCPGWNRALLAGMALGLAELTKYTWIVLFGLWPLLWLAWNHLHARQPFRCHAAGQAMQLLVILLLSLYVINTGYGFEGSFKRLAKYEFVSKMFAGVSGSFQNPPEFRNRFSETWLGFLPVPLPKNYVMGIDSQRADFERRFQVYLAGEWHRGGSWYYYLYALAIKLPLGTWLLFLLALLVTLRGQPYAASWQEELVLLAPLSMVFLLVSWQTGVQYLRYALPLFPFAFVWISKVARAFEFGWARSARPTTLPRQEEIESDLCSLVKSEADPAAVPLPPPGPSPNSEGTSSPSAPVGRKRKGTPKDVWVHRVIAILAAGALVWSVASSLWIYPHSLSYFNELVGGPRGGPRHLLDSNIDWGQDLLYLKRWLDRHPGVTLAGLAYWGSYPATLAGLPETPPPPPGPSTESSSARRTVAAGNGWSGLEPVGPRPGWYALSVNNIYSRDQQYRYFLEFEPVGMAGYSIYIYHITLEEANRLRRELGLPEVPQ